MQILLSIQNENCIFTLLKWVEIVTCLDDDSGAGYLKQLFGAMIRLIQTRLEYQLARPDQDDVMFKIAEMVIPPILSRLDGCKASAVLMHDECIGLVADCFSLITRNLNQS